MEFIKPFWDEYGYSIIMLLAHGILIGVIIEFTVKKLYDSLIAKAEGTKKDKLTRGKAVASLIVGAVLTLAATASIVKSMPLPGGAYFYGFWFALLYMVQYLVSLYGIKWLKKKQEESKTKTKPAKEPKPKKRTVSIDADTKIYKALDDGTFMEI